MVTYECGKKSFLNLCSDTNNTFRREETIKSITKKKERIPVENFVYIAIISEYVWRSVAVMHTNPDQD